MKKIIFLAAAALLAAACEQPRTEQSRTLEAKPASLAFEAADNAPRTVTGTARNVPWEVSVDETAASWLEAVKSDENTLTVTAADNASENERTATVTIADPEGSVRPVAIAVIQAAGSGTPPLPEATLSCDKTELSFGWEGNASQQFTVTAPDGIVWKASADITAAGWLTVETDGNIVTVTAAENTSDAPRTGKVNIKSDDKSVQAATVSVTQAGCDVQPSLTVDQTELNFKAIDKEPRIVRVTTVRLSKWRIQITQDIENPVFSTITNPDEGTITVEAIRNISTSPRTGTITVMAEGVPDVVITVTQEGSDSDAKSTLADDVELTSDHFAVSRIVTYSDQLDIETQTNWILEMYGGECQRNPNTGWLIGTGTFLQLTLVNDRVTDYSVLPEGTYTVDDSRNVDPDTGLPLYRTPAIVAGRYTRPGFYGSSYFVRYENDSETEGTPIFGGTLTVTREGERYTMVFDLKDDAENTISGTFSGEITEFVVN